MERSFFWLKFKTVHSHIKEYRIKRLTIVSEWWNYTWLFILVIWTFNHTNMITHTVSYSAHPVFNLCIKRNQSLWHSCKRTEAKHQNTKVDFTTFFSFAKNEWIYYKNTQLTTECSLSIQMLRVIVTLSFHMFKASGLLQSEILWNK